MLTAFGELSRNRSFGYRIGKGENMEEVLKGGKGVVEGLPTLEVVRDFAKEKGIELPILE
jgi:glycerol-3-phosphate dehydrogenase